MRLLNMNSTYQQTEDDIKSSWMSDVVIQYGYHHAPSLATGSDNWSTTLQLNNLIWPAVQTTQREIWR